MSLKDKLDFMLNLIKWCDNNDYEGLVRELTYVVAKLVLEQDDARNRRVGDT